MKGVINPTEILLQNYGLNKHVRQNIPAKMLFNYIICNIKIFGIICVLFTKGSSFFRQSL